MNTQLTDIKYRPKFFTTEDGTPAILLSGVDHFDANAVFDCGQAFRFRPIEGSSHSLELGGVAHGRYISVAQDGEDIIIYGANEGELFDIWYHYLALDFDIDSAISDILLRSDNPALGAAVSYGEGIRILRQERWETLCSFIISQNNNIPRIRGLIERISAELGERAKCACGMERHGAGDEYAFPTPAAIVTAGVERLRELKLGFRAPYIYDAACRICEGELDLDAVASVDSTEEAAQMLMTVKGVGPKVAACTLLFGFERDDAFPVDVWVRRVIEKYFAPPFDASALGPYRGLAQQYLFYYERSLN